MQLASVSKLLTCAGGAEHALVYGSLSRACGIPTVWVKSLDVRWIRQFVSSGRFDGGSGHVYLEVFLAGRWRLLDATQDELFDSYDPHHRLLPGPLDARSLVRVERYAYRWVGSWLQLSSSSCWTERNE